MTQLSKRTSFDTVFAKEFLDNINDAFFVFDFSLHFIYANKKAMQLVSKTKRQLIGKTVSEVFPEVKKMRMYIEYIRARKTIRKRPFGYYSPAMKKWLSVSVYPTKFGIVVRARDITDIKKAEEAAKESQDILNAFFENSPVSLVIYDEEMKFLKVDNYTAKVFFGRKPKDLIGKPLKTLTAEYAGKIEDTFQEVLQKNKQVVSEFSILYKNNMFHGLSSRFPVYFANGKKGVGSITLDITERFKHEQRKDDFIAMASHELKTPLTSAKIFIQVLERKFKMLEDTESSKLLFKVDEKIRRLETLIKVLLDATLTNRRKISVKKERFILKELALQTIDELQLSMKHRLVVDWQTNEHLYADKERIAQVLINLINNAGKYSMEETDIIIRSRKKDRSIIISVQDFGIGISHEDQAKVFERFYQSDTQSTYPGLGLGLYIAKEIIKENGGDIWIDSKVGKGSTFSFSLPIAAKSNSSIHQAI